MPKYLKRPKWSKVDLVDRPADPHARVLLYKSEDGEPIDEDYLLPEGTVAVGKREFSTEQREKEASKGNALPDGSFPIANVSDLKNAIQAFGRAKDKEKAKRHIIKRARALGATNLLPESWNVRKTEEEGTMPELTEEVFKSLPEEAQDLITALKRKLEEGTQEPSPAPEDQINKNEDLPAEVLDAIAKRDAEVEVLKEKLEKAEEIAKAERDTRLTREWEARVSELKALSLPEDIAVTLKKAADADATLAEGLLETLKKANEVADSAAIFQEIGKGSPAKEGSGEADLEKVVKSLREDDPTLSEHAAWDKALELHPDLYENYVKEVR